MNMEHCEAMVARDGFQSKCEGNGVYTRVIRWSDRSSCPKEEVADKFLNLAEKVKVEEWCKSCRTSAAETVTFALMAVITQVPQMTTDLQRTTVFGDVNCQSTMGFLSSVMGCFSALMALRSFGVTCYRGLPLEGMSDWHPGMAYLCLWVASFLKLWDAFSPLAVPTPPARHH